MKKFFVLCVVFVTMATSFMVMTSSAHAVTFIGTCSELQNMSVSENYELSGPINCNNSGFTPIGDFASPFTGTFDGFGYTISGLTINATADYAGLFGVSSGTIRDVFISATVNGSTHSAVGVAVGLNLGVINNVHTSGTVSGRDGIAGMVGYNSGTVGDSSADVDVTAEFYGGGFVGGHDSGNIFNSSAQGDVIDTSFGDSGGFVAYSGGTISNSYATGNVTGSSTSDMLGGFAGSISGSVTDSFSTGDVSSQAAIVGGFVGSASNNHTISDCNSYGDVTSAEGQVGGFVGNSEDFEITRSFAQGNVTAGNEPSGGFVGSARTGTNISQSFATGDVNGDFESGGFVGSLRTNADVVDVFARGNVTGVEQVGGFVGDLDGGNITNAYSTGTVEAREGTTEFGGFAGYYHAGTSTNTFWDTQSSAQSTSAHSETGKTTAQMKNIATYTDTSSAGLDSAWDFEGTENDDAATDDIWLFNAPHNEGYPLFDFFPEIEDNDGVSADIENAGPNGGDANNDGILDWKQYFVASFKNAVTGKYVVVETSGNCQILDISSTTESTSTPDIAFDYPQGLITFSAQACASAPIKLYFYDVDNSAVTARKFNSGLGTYSTLTTATLAATSIDGHDVVTASYELIDNGPYDTDPDNGEITDPFGIAVAVLGAPRTGGGGTAN